MRLSFPKKKRSDRFDLISPTDFRYYDDVSALIPYLSEEAFMHYKLDMEASLADIKAERGMISREDAELIKKYLPEVLAAEVYREEDITRHDIIAKVNVIKRKIGQRFRSRKSREAAESARRAVHWPATSYDKVDPANMKRYAVAFNNVIMPQIADLMYAWIDVTRRESDTLQIGRTHLQHAEPITFGFSYAWYLSRMGNRLMKIREGVDALEGKFSGAVGAYNATSMFVDDPEQFEKDVLSDYGLRPAEISTQIASPEPMTDLVHYTISAFSVLANWADDTRNLMSPEIGEIMIPRGPDVSRSSTMPHKQNPVGPENVKSMWKEVMPRMITMYMDQVSDFQRDLTNSASQRYTPEIFALFYYSVNRTARVSRSIVTRSEMMRKNFEMSGDKIMAEPLQILLSYTGHPDAHAYIGRVSDAVNGREDSLVETVYNDPEAAPYVARFTGRQREILDDPSKYTGIASQKALKVADAWEKRLNDLGYARRR